MKALFAEEAKKSQVYPLGDRGTTPFRGEKMKTIKHRNGAFMKTTTILAATVAGALAFASARAVDVTPAETQAIAEEGFIYGLPLVMNYALSPSPPASSRQ